MYFWNGIKQRWQKVGCVAFSQNDNKRLILGSLKRRRQRKLQNNSNRFRPRQHVFVFVWKTEKSVVIYSCTWENRPVHGLGKWCAKFWTGKFRLESRLPENGREGQKLVSKMAWREWSREKFAILYLKPRSYVWAWGIEMKPEFPFRTFRLEKQDYLFRCSGVPGNFPLQRPKTSSSIYFPTGFSGTFCSWQTTIFSSLACAYRPHVSVENVTENAVQGLNW